MDYRKHKKEKGVRIARESVLLGDVELGEDSCVLFYSTIRGDKAPVRVGRGTNIQEGCTIHVDHGYPVTLGDYVTVGHHAVLHGCTIGDRSLIGIGAAVLNGAVIGKDCLIAAGSLVLQNMQVPDGSLVMGSPARIVRPLRPEEKESNYRNSLEYVEEARKMEAEGILLSADHPEEN